jgi:hypothetical protein
MRSAVACALELNPYQPGAIDVVRMLEVFMRSTDSVAPNQLVKTGISVQIGLPAWAG